MQPIDFTISIPVLSNEMTPADIIKEILTGAENKYNQAFTLYKWSKNLFSETTKKQAEQALLNLKVAARENCAVCKLFENAEEYPHFLDALNVAGYTYFSSDYYDVYNIKIQKSINGVLAYTVKLN
jgi:hypothetical protein